jgi:hypothetical protein
MSNHLAFAAVTETLRRMLDDALRDSATGVTGASATAVRPTGSGNSGAGGGLPATGANVFLYHVTPNAAGRNLDLPTRRQDGSAVTRPQAAFDLSYLISFYGADSTLEPQRVLGVIVRTLHTRSFLSRPTIDNAVSAAGFLLGSDLSAAAELVRFSPHVLTLEELSRIWGIFYQVPYVLSICYQASVLFIEDAAPVAAALPVRSRNVVSVPLDPPRIEALAPQPVFAGDTLTISGRSVGRNVPFVQLSDGLPFAATVVDADQIQITLPALSAAGVGSLRVLRMLDLGTGSAFEPHQGFESNVVAMALAPRITTPLSPATVVPRGSTFALAIDAPVGQLQRVALVLGSRAILLPTRPTNVPTTALSFTIPSDLPTGPILVRVQVDGVDSPLTADTVSGSPTFGQYIAPQITIS